MQRNWDIIRKILLKVEQLPTEDSTFASNELEGVDSEAVAYHMRNNWGQSKLKSALLV